MWWEKREVMELKTLSTRLRMRCLKRSTSGPLAARGVTPVAHFHVNAVELAQTVFNPVAGKARIGIKLGSRRQRQGQRLQAALISHRARHNRKLHGQALLSNNYMHAH